MLTFKSLGDLHHVPPENTFHAVIFNLLQSFPRNPDADGYLILIQQGDTFIDLPELQCHLTDLPWEGVTKQDGHFYGVVLTNNQFALEFLIPDEPWLPADIRASLEVAIV